MQRMQRRPARVSESQWSILLDFLERNPFLTRPRGYNNSARARAESSRKWAELARVLNAERSGTAKTPKDWSVYVSNYKSKLRKTLADLNANSSATGRGPPSGDHFSDTELRFLSLLGPGFSQNVPGVAADALQNMNHQSTAAMNNQTPNTGAGHIKMEVFEAPELNNDDSSSVSDEPHAAPASTQNVLTTNPMRSGVKSVPLRRRTLKPRYRSRPFTPLDDDQRVWAQSRAAQQQAAADMATAQANNLIAQNLGRLADAVERYLSHIGVP